MHCVLVVWDFGNGEMLKRHAKALAERGHTADCFLGVDNTEGEPKEQFLASLKKADWLILSYSSVEKLIKGERFAFESALERGVRVAVVSDIFGMASRSQWFGDLSPHADILTVIDEGELSFSRQYVGKETTILHVPNPYWVDWFRSPCSRDEVRERLGVDLSVKLIFAGGSKERDRNEALFRDVVKACNAIPGNLEIVLTLHPRAEDKMEVYGDILKSSVHPICLVDGKEMGISSQDMLAGVDLLISPESTMGPMAGCKRIPNIVLSHECDQLWWKSLSQLDYWPPARWGVSHLATDMRGLREAMVGLLNPESVTSAMQRMAWERYLRPEIFDGGCNTFIDALERMRG